MPLGAQARGGGRQPWLAAWLSALLVLAPFARPSVPAELAAALVAVPQAVVTEDDPKGPQPAAGLRPAEPFTPGIIARLALLDTTLGLPPAKPPLLRPAADQPALAHAAAMLREGAPAGVFQRSAVGTARTPTGPPA